MPTEFEWMDKNTEKANPNIKRPGFHSTNLLRLECQLVIDIDLYLFCDERPGFSIYNAIL